MARFVVFKRAGEIGKVAVNPSLVTEIRSTSPVFTDIHFGEHRVAVEGTLDQVIERLSDQPEPEGLGQRPANWLQPGSRAGRL